MNSCMDLGKISTITHFYHHMIYKGPTKLSRTYQENVILENNEKH
jgi:hypothetical protein